MRGALILTAATALALAGCSKGSEPPIAPPPPKLAPPNMPAPPPADAQTRSR